MSAVPSVRKWATPTPAAPARTRRRAGERPGGYPTARSPPLPDRATVPLPRGRWRAARASPEGSPPRRSRIVLVRSAWERPPHGLAQAPVPCHTSLVRLSRPRVLLRAALLLVGAAFMFWRAWEARAAAR